MDWTSNKRTGWLLRVLVIGLLVWLGGAMPVAAADTVYIGTAAELTAFAARVNGGEAELNGVLTADIVLRSTNGWADWGDTPPADPTQWTPIGNISVQYYGTFDGAGYTVRGIYIDAPTSAFQGLFGYTLSPALIKNLSISESYIRGGGDTGGVVGSMYGTITNCTNSGVVSGADYNAGGVAGWGEAISNCKNTGTVSGNISVGGVVGEAGFVYNCYNDGVVSGYNYVGGIVGSGNAISNCFNTSMVSGSSNCGSVAGRASALTNCYYQTGTAATGCGTLPDTPNFVEAKPDSAFASGEVAYRLNKVAGFDKANWRHWTQNPGEPRPSLAIDGVNSIDQKITFDYSASDDSYGYGCLGGAILSLPSPPVGSLYTYTNSGTTRSQAALASYLISSELTFTVDQYNLTVNDEGVIEIDTAAELADFGRYVNNGNTAANGQLTADIALRDTAGWTLWGDTPPMDTTQWTPIGSSSHAYAGSFDGAGYTVSGIYINAPSGDKQGLFGQVTGSITNLGVSESYISGDQYVGGVAGNLVGTISNCFNRGTVNGGGPVGGVTGRVITLTKCYNSGVVSGRGLVGGVTGLGTNLSNCYNSGGVSGTASVALVGGVAGRGDNLSNCYNSGDVSSDNFVGALTCIVTNISNCYYRTGSAAAGVMFSADVAGQSEAKTAAAFTSGEVAWRLQNGQTVPADPLWGQRLTVDALPLLKTADRICQVTFAAGNGMATEAKAYVNQNGTVTPPLAATGYDWQDSSQAVFSAATDVTGDISVRCEIAALPTAAAVYGTKLRDIAFSGGSVPTANWSWSAPATDLDQLLAVGNDLDYPATYTPADAGFEIKNVAITPTITPRSLSEATISQPANVAYSGAAIEPPITVSDSGAVITPADYTISYDKNISPGTATVTITGQGNYQGEVTRNFTITASGGGGGGYTPPGMSGITVTPHNISFDPSGQITVDISGLPAGATVFYSLDGSSYSTTPPAITRAGEYPLYLRISCPGYQDFSTQTTVTVAKQSPPQVSPIEMPMPPQQQQYSLLLGQPLPADRGLTQYQVGVIDDPEELLDGPPTIAADGAMTCTFRRSLSAADDGTSQQTAEAPARNADGLETAARTATIMVLVSMENYEDTTLTVVVSEAEPIGLRYLTHIQDYGWETDWVTAGALSGTAGQSKRLEALKVELTGDIPAGARIDTAVHVQNLGDLGPFAMGSEAGTSGKSLRLENITLTLENLPGYSLCYNVHVQNQGWLRDEADPSSWFTSGEVAGTSGKSLRLEAIRMVLVKDE